MHKAIFYINSRVMFQKIFNHRTKKFLIAGFVAAIVNLLTMSFLIELLGFKGYYLRNLANIIAMEISIFFNFFLQRIWTWGDAPKKQGKSLVLQFILFNSAAVTGVLIRIVLFAILEMFKVFYLINVTIGIATAATIDFILYDKFVFRRNEYGTKDI